jgi:hypothetical protein
MHVDGKYISTYFITMVGCQTWIHCKSIFCPYIIHPARHICECCFRLAISKLKIASSPYKLPQYDHQALHLVWYLHLLEWVLLDATSNPRNVKFGLLRTLIMFYKEILTNCRNNPKNNLSFLWLCQCGCWLVSRTVRYHESKIPYMIPIFTQK